MSGFPTLDDQRAPGIAVDAPGGVDQADAVHERQHAAALAKQAWQNGQAVAAADFARQVAAALGADVDLIWQRLTEFPENMIVLLDSPQGWKALADIIRDRVGATRSDPFIPSSH